LENIEITANTLANMMNKYGHQSYAMAYIVKVGKPPPMPCNESFTLSVKDEVPNASRTLRTTSANKYHVDAFLMVCESA
jgi:hypothetical protein